MIILLIYLFSMSGFVKSNENSELSNRFLPSWSSYSSWNSCNNDYYWTFLNNSCVSTSSSTVASDSYSFNTESAYCSSYVSSGVIYLNSTGSNFLYLYQLSGASISEHPTCYWRIMNPSLTPIYLKFQKPVLNYEDIYVLYSYNSIYYYLTTKDLTNWSDSTTSISLTNVSSLYIKVKRLNTNSNYIIYVSTKSTTTDVSENSGDLVIGIVIVTTVTVFVVAVIVAIFLYVCTRK